MNSDVSRQKDVTDDKQTSLTILGFTVPVGPQGRRQWPEALKKEVTRRLKSGEMSSVEVSELCGVSTKTVYKWKTLPPRKAGRPKRTASDDSPFFAELRTSNQTIPGIDDASKIVVHLPWGSVAFPLHYNVDQLAAFLRALGTGS